MIAAQLTESDALALVMVAVLCFTFSLLVMLLAIITKNAGKEDPLAELNADEIKKTERQIDEEEAAKAKPSTSAWEKDSDWWKKS